MKCYSMDKKKNMGFSLVELVVVVLIIAIIAVALAPQIMKWVTTSKKNTDEYNAASIKYAVIAGVADCQANLVPMDAYTGKALSTYPMPMTTPNDMNDYIGIALGKDRPTTKTNNEFTVDVSTSGYVVVRWQDVDGNSCFK